MSFLRLEPRSSVGQSLLPGEPIAPDLRSARPSRSGKRLRQGRSCLCSIPPGTARPAGLVVIAGHQFRLEPSSASLRCFAVERSMRSWMSRSFVKSFGSTIDCDHRRVRLREPFDGRLLRLLERLGGLRLLGVVELVVADEGIEVALPVGVEQPGGSFCSSRDGDFVEDAGRRRSRGTSGPSGPVDFRAGTARRTSEDIWSLSSPRPGMMPADR